MKKQYLDNGFYMISTADAKKLSAEGGLPRPGYERWVSIDGKGHWLSQTIHKGMPVWSIRETEWTYDSDKKTLILQSRE